MRGLEQSFPEPFRSEPGHYGRAILEGTERGYLLEMKNCGTEAERGSLAARLRVHLVPRKREKENERERERE